MLKRRYEVLLPTHHDDDPAAVEELLRQLATELASELAKFEPHVATRVWVFTDLTPRLVADVDDTPAYRRFFVDYKASLRRRFEVSIVSYPVDVL